MSGSSSSHPAELSLKLLSVFKTSFWENGSKIEIAVLLVTTYSAGLLFDKRMLFANETIELVRYCLPIFISDLS